MGHAQWCTLVGWTLFNANFSTYHAAQEGGEWGEDRYDVVDYVDYHSR